MSLSRKLDSKQQESLPGLEQHQVLEKSDGYKALYQDQIYHAVRNPHLAGVVAIPGEARSCIVCIDGLTPTLRKLTMQGSPRPLLL